ncbi:unnamed protein product [Oppiella nova]|uniref:C2H2-type domain-containing protein n=1 Tax=Oppiella nova TaxID=334625 RepID=A0A7R9LK01_9ACAR|nr:unnamed protein product [Oppiella nova]CAG2163732.1 unnamed protein product [Oppiella nova]
MNQISDRGMPSSAPIFHCQFRGCKKWFKHKKYYDIHSKSHSSDPKTKCLSKDCDFVSSDRNELIGHMISCHSVFPFVCGLTSCRQLFTTKDELEIHTKTHPISGNESHSSREQLKCSVNGCDFECVLQSTLDEHMNNHNGAQPYQCTREGCVQRFNSNYRLWDHMRNDHRICAKVGVNTKTVPKFICLLKDCEKRFETKELFITHVNSHSSANFGSKCLSKDCIFMTTNRNDLIGHMIATHSMSPFLCGFTFCGQLFATKDELEIHAKTHRMIIERENN